jgi:hypothetical protein
MPEHLVTTIIYCPTCEAKGHKRKLTEVRIDGERDN